MDEVFIDMRKENHWIQKYFPNKDFVSIYDLLGCIEDLDADVEQLKEKIEDMERDIQENYKWIGSGEPDWHDIQDNKPSWWID